MLWHDGPVQQASISPDGRFIVTASDDGTARAWVIADAVPCTILPHGAAVSLAAFSRDGRRAVTIGGDSAKIWDAPPGPSAPP